MYILKKGPKRAKSILNNKNKMEVIWSITYHDLYKTTVIQMCYWCKDRQKPAE